MKKVYRTKDLQLASYILASGHDRYSLAKEGRVVYFEFTLSDGEPENTLEIQEGDYWQNSTSIEPKKLFTAYNELRLRLRNLGL